MKTSTMGLRDRKRRETRARLERAAVSLVLEQGLERTTIDQISEAADVSTRTFFNYFETKEDALLGLHDTGINEELIAEHLAAAHGATGRELVRFVLHLMTEMLGPRLIEAGAEEERMQLIERYPQLISRAFVQMNQRMEAVTVTVRQLTGTSPANSAWPELMVALCGLALRLNVRTWATTAGGSLNDLEERASALVYETLEKLK